MRGTHASTLRAPVLVPKYHVYRTGTCALTKSEVARLLTDRVTVGGRVSAARWHRAHAVRLEMGTRPNTTVCGHCGAEICHFPSAADGRPMARPMALCRRSEIRPGSRARHVQRGALTPCARGALGDGQTSKDDRLTPSWR